MQLSLLMTHVAGQLPMVLAAMVGVIFAIASWERTPRAARLTILAAGLLILFSLGQAVSNAYLFDPAFRQQMFPDNIAQYSQFLQIVGLGWSIADAACVATICIAVFVDRAAHDTEISR
jgi:Na+/H+ antiporter NhaB